MDIHKRSRLIGTVLIAIGLLGCSSHKGAGARGALSSTLPAGRWVSLNTDKRIALALDMSEQDGQVAGDIWIADPVTKEWLFNGVLSGTHQGTTIDCADAGMMSFHGTLKGSRIDGDIHYAAWKDQPARSFPLTLVLEKS